MGDRCQTPPAPFRPTSRQLPIIPTAWTTGPDYGLSFGYDGFGNKLSQTVTKGSAPASSITVDAYNRIAGQTYDANGNRTSGASSTLTYDVDNRVFTTAPVHFSAPSQTTFLFFSAGASAGYRYTFAVPFIP